MPYEVEPNREFVEASTPGPLVAPGAPPKGYGEILQIMVDAMDTAQADDPSTMTDEAWRTLCCTTILTALRKNGVIA